MSYYGDSGVITVNVKGSAETEFTSVTFKATVTTQAPLGPEAKEMARPAIEAIKKTILEHAETVGIDTHRLKTSFSVDSYNDRQTGKFSGYEARYTISFNGKNVVEALKLHDALTSLRGVEAPTPVFNIDDSADVHARAFNLAAAKAFEKFNNQCVALKLTPTAFEVASWSIDEEQPRGKTLSFSEGATAKPVGLEPGKASLDMRVTFAFRRRSLQ